jgi:hypothetical protein
MSSYNRDSILMVGWKTTKTSIVSIFLCLLLNISFGVLSSILGNVGLINLIFDILLSLVILYPPLCDHGNADANLHSFGYIEPDLKRGFIIGLFSLIPYWLLSLPVLVMKLFSMASFAQYFRLYRVIYSPFTITLMNLCPSTELSSVSYFDILIMFALPLIFVVAGGIFYIFGFKRIIISDKLIYKK